MQGSLQSRFKYYFQEENIYTVKFDKLEEEIEGGSKLMSSKTIKWRWCIKKEREHEERDLTLLFIDALTGCRRQDCKVVKSFHWYCVPMFLYLPYPSHRQLITD